MIDVAGNVRRSPDTRLKSPNTIANACQLLGASVLPVIGKPKAPTSPADPNEEHGWPDARLREVDTELAQIAQPGPLGKR